MPASNDAMVSSKLFLRGSAPQEGCPLAEECVGDQ